MLDFVSYGGVRIFRPSPEIEANIRQSAREHLLSRFPAGEYRGAKAANGIIQHQFNFYQKHLRPAVKRLPRHDTLDFLFSQYDASCRILHGNAISDPAELQSWGWVEPMFRRAIKYIAELLCIKSFSVPKGIDHFQAQEALETAMVCAESMVYMAHESDLVHSIFPDDCLVSVRDKGPVHCNIAITGNHAGYDRDFQARIIRDRESRDKFVPSPQFDNHTDTHARYLDPAFKESFGITYAECIATIMSVINGSQPAPNRPGLFIHRGKAIDQLSKSGRPPQGIERAIDGFSITARNLMEEQRVVWNPKQEHRAYRRGFYVFRHPSGPHLAFSRSMAQENLVQLVNWVPYKHLPEEWKTPETVAALATLSRAAGEWFEHLICKCFSELGIIGQPCRRRVGNGQNALNIPDKIGDIDFLGHCPKQCLLVIIEAKMVMSGLEARYWRDDLHEFVFGSGSYADHFQKKRAWIKENTKAIAAALGCGNITGIASAMLTLYPCIARQFIPDFQCVSLTEFLLDYEEHSRWPYPTD